MAAVTVKECITSFVSALKEKNAAIFAGAGFSKASGFVDWKELMRDIAIDLGLDVDKETDLIAIAQYHINERLGNRNIINQSIIDHFTKDAEVTENHKILAELPITTYWTTNYDNLIERSLEAAGKTPDTKIISENICITKSKRDAVIYKMHGDASLPNDAVLTKEDYETYELNRSAYSIVLQADLVSKTFLFVGFSFEDPNLIYIFTRIKNLLGTKSTRNHYCIFKRETDPDKLRKQEFKLKDLNRYGIFAVLVDNYSQITDILKKIDHNYKRSHIFISGAAEVFNEYGSEKKAIELIHNLSKRIIANKKKLISGFGYKVGSAVINGALEYIFSTKYRKIDEYLKLMPFPQLNSGELDGATQDEIMKRKKERNNLYRDLMISEAGIAIFIFGNKLLKKDGKDVITNSNGMYDEFKIAKEKGVKPIPIGATGYMAREIWEEVINDYDKYYNGDPEIKQWLTILGDNTQSNDQLINCTYSIIQKLNN